MGRIKVLKEASLAFVLLLTLVSSSLAFTSNMEIQKVIAPAGGQIDVFVYGTWDDSVSGYEITINYNPAKLQIDTGAAQGVIGKYVGLEGTIYDSTNSDCYIGTGSPFIASGSFDDNAGCANFQLTANLFGNREIPARTQCPLVRFPFYVISDSTDTACIRIDACAILGTGSAYLIGTTAFPPDDTINACINILTEPQFVRGDANGDGDYGLIDVLYILIDLFGGGPPPPCQNAADINGDGFYGFSDAFVIVSDLYGGGDPPPAPYPSCGSDPIPDALTCDSYLPCGWNSSSASSGVRK